MIPMSGSEGPTKLINVVDSTSQWNSHYSGTCAPGRPGWFLFSSYDSTDRGARRWADDNILLIELKPNPIIYRLADHRTTRYYYWQEPHASMSPDGLRVIYSCSWDTTSLSDPSIAYMIGLPSWIYGTTPGDPPPPPSTSIINGTFDANLNSWTITNGGWVWSAGTALFATGSAASSLRQPFAFEGGVEYTIEFDLTEYTGTGDMAVRFIGNGVLNSTPNINGNGHKEYNLSAISGDNTLSMAAFVGFGGKIDNIVVYPATTNLLGNGTFDDATGWSLAANCTVTLGRLHCNNTAANVTNSYATTVLTAGTYNVAFDLVDFNAGNVTMRINSGGTIVSGAIRSAGTTPSGSYSDNITIAATSTAFEIRVTRQGTTMDVKIDNIVITAV